MMVDVKLLKGLSLEDGTNILRKKGYSHMDTYTKKYGGYHFFMQDDNDNYIDVIYFGPEGSIWKKDKKTLKLLKFLRANGVTKKTDIKEILMNPLSFC